MKKEKSKQPTHWCTLGAIGGILMAAGDWLLGQPVTPDES